MAGLLVATLPQLLSAQVDFNTARTLVGKSQRDLSGISNAAAASAKEKERYDNAMRHLSEFDDGLAHNKFDKGKLDNSIDDIDNVCKNNTLRPEERDVLLGDLRELRHLREDRKN
jgi:hypothetical protein